MAQPTPQGGHAPPYVVRISAERARVDTSTRFVSKTKVFATVPNLSHPRRTCHSGGRVPVWHSLCNQMMYRLCGPPRPETARPVQAPHLDAATEQTPPGGVPPCLLYIQSTALEVSRGPCSGLGASVVDNLLGRAAGVTDGRSAAEHGLGPAGAIVVATVATKVSLSPAAPDAAHSGWVNTRGRLGAGLSLVHPDDARWMGHHVSEDEQPRCPRGSDVAPPRR